MTTFYTLTGVGLLQAFVCLNSANGHSRAYISLYLSFTPNETKHTAPREPGGVPGRGRALLWEDKAGGGRHGLAAAGTRRSLKPSCSAAFEDSI